MCSTEQIPSWSPCSAQLFLYNTLLFLSMLKDPSNLSQTTPVLAVNVMLILADTDCLGFWWLGLLASPVQFQCCVQISLLKAWLSQKVYDNAIRNRAVWPITFRLACNVLYTDGFKDKQCLDCSVSVVASPPDRPHQLVVHVEDEDVQSGKWTTDRLIQHVGQLPS